MERHITALGAIYIAFSVVNLFLGAMVFIVLTGSGLISRDPQALAITSTVGSIVSSFLILVALPGLIGGIGLLQRRSWSRILVLIVGALELLHFPIGTLVGAYTIWVLTRPESEAVLSR